MRKELRYRYTVDLEGRVIPGTGDEVSGVGRPRG